MGRNMAASLYFKKLYNCSNRIKMTYLFYKVNIKSDMRILWIDIIFIRLERLYAEREQSVHILSQPLFKLLVEDSWSAKDI